MLAALLADLWRGIVHLADWRSLWRLLTGRPSIDVAIITNVRDEQERWLFWGSRIPREGHTNGARIHLDGIAGRIRGLYVTAEQLYTKQGRQIARQQFINAVSWADRRGARVVLLAASTKRLFGRNGTELRKMFPHITFTIGDNGTALMLCQDVLRALRLSRLAPGSRILVAGAYGILGTEVTRFLLEQRYEVVGFGTNGTLLADFSRQFPIELHSGYAAAGKVDAVIACTHSREAKLTRESVEQLRRPCRRLLVVDVAEPANLDAETFGTCQHVVTRQDAGNARAASLRFVLGGISSRMLDLPDRTVFGCFAEAMALYHGIYREQRRPLAERDWFQVNADNIALIEPEMASLGFAPPAPHCFGQPVSDFNLALRKAPGDAGMTDDADDVAPLLIQ